MEPSAFNTMEATLEDGFENFGVLVRLKASALNSLWILSLILNVRKTLKFKFHDHALRRGKHSPVCA